MFDIKAMGSLIIVSTQEMIVVSFIENMVNNATGDIAYRILLLKIDESCGFAGEHGSEDDFEIAVFLGIHLREMVVSF